MTIVAITDLPSLVLLGEFGGKAKRIFSPVTLSRFA